MPLWVTVAPKYYQKINPYNIDLLYDFLNQAQPKPKLYIVPVVSNDKNICFDLIYPHFLATSKSDFSMQLIDLRTSVIFSIIPSNTKDFFGFVIHTN